MGAVRPWEVAKLALAEQLYAALVDLLGAVEALLHTGASLSWRTPAGIQGHWREEHGQFWFGRILTDVQGTGVQSEQLAVTLESLGEDAERVWLAHPTVHHWRSAEGQVGVSPPDTERLYVAAHGLLTQLREEVRELFPCAREHAEEQGGTEED